MKHIESKIPQFYDILTDELNNVRYIYDCFMKEARKVGFDEIQTTAIELRGRYLSATKVHYSKIFEVHRVKESTRYVLQSDLAISMSRFVADLPVETPLKLIQMGTMFRDRIPKVPTWRREFQQILIGTWGGSSYFYDAEIIALACRALNAIRGTKVCYVKISNYNIYNVMLPGAAEEIRFHGQSLASIMEKAGIDEKDRLLLTALYQSPRTSIAELQQAVNDISHSGLKEELSKVIKVMQYYKMLEPNIDIFFSCSTISGTGHYSGLNYKIFISINEGEPFQIADGGRIDTLCELINKRNVPAVCLGIGSTELSQKIAYEERNRIFVLLDEDYLKEEEERLIKIILQAQQELQCSIFPLRRKKWRQVLMSDFYQNCIFLTCEKGKVSIRLGNQVSQQFYEAHMDKLNEIKAALES